MRSRTQAELAGQFARFVTVGLTNTALSLVVYWLLVVSRVPYPAAAAAGFAAGAVNGYIWNRRWTFAAADTGAARLRYVVVQAAGLGGTSALVSVLVSSGALGRLGGYALTIPLITVATFAANRGWTFASHPPAEAPPAALPSPHGSRRGNADVRRAT